MPPPIVVYADFESAIVDNYKHKPIMLFCLAVSRIPAIQTHLRVFHAPHEKERDSFLHRIPVAIASECEEAFLRWITLSKALLRSIEIIAPQLCVSSVTWKWQWGNSRDPRRGFLGCLLQGETSRKCGRWIHHREGRHVLLRGWAVHLHLLYQMQSPTLLQQEKLSFVHLLPQWIALRFHIHHETHRSSFNL